MFQSHAGSIEACTRPPDCPLVFLFQSHAGSIEAKAMVVGIFMSLVSFNPTLVRLRPYLAAEDGKPVDMFQSHAGSIEAVRSMSVRIC